MQALSETVYPSRSVQGTCDEPSSLRTKHGVPAQTRVEGPSFPCRFRILGGLGQGGMGVVLHAMDAKLGQPIALKFLMTPLQPDHIYRLKREFRCLSEMRHPNIVRAHELFLDRHRCFFTMELVSGLDFLSFVRRQVHEPARCDYQRLRDAARQLASAIQCLHENGNLHRDLKPSNVMVTWEGRVVLLDFGLTTPISSDGVTTRGARALLGSPGYIAPEQARGEALTRAADWYGFGVTLYEAITGRLPFEDGFRALLVNRRPEEIVRVDRYAPDAPEELNHLIAGLLDPRADQRPAGEDVLRALAGQRRSVSTWRRPKPARSRSPRPSIERELRTLAHALERIRSGGTEIVRILHAPKAPRRELARRFTHHAQSGGALVLRGGCNPRESITMNALDRVIDAVSHSLEHMPYPDVLSVLPADAATLPALFPVLGRLAETNGETANVPVEPHAQTLRRARVAVRDLLAGLAERQPLVIWIEDMQWCDEESADLLSEVLAPPGAPRVLLVLGFCQADLGRTIALRRIGENVPSRDLVIH